MGSWIRLWHGPSAGGFHRGCRRDGGHRLATCGAFRFRRLARMGRRSGGCRTSVRARVDLRNLCGSGDRPLRGVRPATVHPGDWCARSRRFGSPPLRGQRRRGRDHRVDHPRRDRYRLVGASQAAAHALLRASVAAPCDLLRPQRLRRKCASALELQTRCVPARSSGVDRHCRPVRGRGRRDVSLWLLPSAWRTFSSHALPISTRGTTRTPRSSSRW